jgi:hypothetical protein
MVRCSKLLFSRDDSTAYDLKAVAMIEIKRSILKKSPGLFGIGQLSR